MILEDSRFIIPTPGRYRLWAATETGNTVTIEINGKQVGLDSESYVGPFSDPKTEGDQDCAGGDVVTVTPGSARLIVSRHPDFTRVYDSHQL